MDGPRLALTASTAADDGARFTPSAWARVVGSVTHGRRLIWILAGFIGAAALSLSARTSGLERIPGGLAVPWWILLATFALCEILVVHVTFGANSLSFGLSEVPISLSFCSLAPLPAVAVRLAGAIIGLSWKRVRGVKLAFNLASAALETTVATMTYRAVLGTAAPLSSRGWAALLIASLAIDLVSGITIYTAMSLADERFDPSILPEVALSGIASATVNGCVAIVTVIVLSTDPYAGFALAVVAGVVLVSYRAWTHQQRRHSQLQLLYDVTCTLGTEPDLSHVALRALREARRLVNAGTAEIVLTGPGTDVRWMRLDDEDCLIDVRVPQGDVWWLALGRGEARHWAVTGRAPTDDVAGRSSGLVTPLRSPRSDHGVLLVADRIDEVSSFTDDDLQMFETLAVTVATELDNAKLVEQLRSEADERAFQALHDPLTGLANRRRFADLLASDLAEHRPVAVLLMDLDRFKEVNDTLGHGAGDEVLCAVATKLTDLLEDDATVARLGGDEFAILLRSADLAEAEWTARAIVSLLESPIRLREIDVRIGASVGIALAPEHGTDPDLLVQRADVAMYLAKAHETGATIYSPERDINDRRRLELVVELGQAITEGRLTVDYQPQIDCRRRTLTRVEALVRWTSRRYGIVGPDEFIPLAECSGLIGQLTEFVLMRAASDVAALHRAGYEIGVAVNLSTRNLLDGELGATVENVLQTSGLPASALTLEITEGTLMREPERNTAILGTLRERGVRVSIDDFGTGYSSLSYLKHLPAQELKIDRAFIKGMEHDSGDRAIVAAVVRLAHDLGLEVVAEGVESASVLDEITELGCDLVQGYHLGRPMPIETIRSLLASRA